MFTRTEIATFSCTCARKDAVTKHQASLQRRKAVVQEFMLGGVHAGPKGNPLVGALPVEVFSEVLAKLQSSDERIQDRPRQRAGGRLRNIRFCLLEAKQERDRDFMKRVATMVLFRGEKA